MGERIGGDQATIMTATKRLNRIFIDEELPECILLRLVSKFDQNFFWKQLLNKPKDNSKKLTIGPFWKKDLFLWCLLFGRFKIARTIWLGCPRLDSQSEN